jgi:hypothetical protein
VPDLFFFAWIRIHDYVAIVFARVWAVVTHRNVIAISRVAPRRRLNFALPSDGEEKFLWRKLFDRNPLFTVACDKLAARDFALSVEPKLRVAPLRWSGTDLEAMPASALAGDVVFKANKGSGMAVLVRNGKPSRAELTALGRRWLATRWGWNVGEWGYADARACLLVEEMLMQDGRPIHREYKFHVAGGITAYVIVKLGTPGGETSFLALDREGRAPSQGDGQPSTFVPPPCFEIMRSVAERLGAHFDFIRVDLYDLEDAIVFGELTVYPSSGVGRSGGQAHFARLRSQMWDLRRSWFLTSPQSGWRAAYATALRRHLDRTAATPVSKLEPVTHTWRPSLNR